MSVSTLQSLSATRSFSLFSLHFYLTSFAITPFPRLPPPFFHSFFKLPCYFKLESRTLIRAVCSSRSLIVYDRLKEQAHGGLLNYFTFIRLLAGLSLRSLITSSFASASMLNYPLPNPLFFTHYPSIFSCFSFFVFPVWPISVAGDKIDRN